MFEGCFKIYINKDCEEGYGYVRDLYGNLIFYGLLSECCTFIECMERRNDHG